MTKNDGTRNARRKYIRSAALLPQFDKRLLAYALAGAGAVTLASPAEAEIIFTPADITFSAGLLPIDLNNDGIPDVMLSNYVTGFSSAYQKNLMVGSSTPRTTEVIGRHTNFWASALPVPLGAPIGPDTRREFIGQTFLPAYIAFLACSPGHCFSGGPWAHLSNRFLGIKFRIGEEVHYGWVRMSVTHAKARITGYAYETIPDQTIPAGHRQSADDVRENDSPEGASLQNDDSPQPATLALLSLGAPGIDSWRRARD